MEDLKVFQNVVVKVAKEIQSREFSWSKVYEEMHAFMQVTYKS